MKKKIAIQGVAGSFHEEAAYKFFGKEIETFECDTFKDVFEALDTGKVDFAAMAIENTVAGSLLTNYSLLRDYHFKIIGETFLHIQMNLMALPDVKINDIETVISHPIAIKQCYSYLYSLKKAKIVEKEDTAGSAKIIRDKQLKNTAAVASKSAAEIYGLNILERNIETNKQNYTRFLVLSKEGIENSENNKASMCFELGHKVGALTEILNIFTKFNINLTKIQSIPIIGKPYEYAFHVDVEWNNVENYEKAIHNVLRKASNLSVLGEYKKGIMDIGVYLEQKN